mgnify:CR=1 FL=1
MLHFRKVYKLSLDNAEFAILTAITVFSDREKIINKLQVKDFFPWEWFAKFPIRVFLF